MPVSPADPEAAGRLAHSFAIRNFLTRAGRSSANRRFLLGDASIRAYETITVQGQETAILMDAPARGDEPAVREGKPYSHIARLAQSVEAFVGIANGSAPKASRLPKSLRRHSMRDCCLSNIWGAGPSSQTASPWQNVMKRGACSSPISMSGIGQSVFPWPPVASMFSRPMTVRQWA